MALPLGTDLRPEVVRALIAAQIPGGDTPGARSALRRLDGSMVAHLSELFGRAGMPFAYRGGRGSPLDLRPAFRAALRWYLWSVGWNCIGIIRRRAAGRRPRRDVVRPPNTSPRRRRSRRGFAG